MWEISADWRQNSSAWLTYNWLEENWFDHPCTRNGYQGAMALASPSLCPTSLPFVHWLSQKSPTVPSATSPLCGTKCPAWTSQFSASWLQVCHSESKHWFRRSDSQFCWDTAWACQEVQVTGGSQFVLRRCAAKRISMGSGPWLWYWIDTCAASTSWSGLSLNRSRWRLSWGETTMASMSCDPLSWAAEEMRVPKALFQMLEISPLWISSLKSPTTIQGFWPRLCNHSARVSLQLPNPTGLR